LRLLIGLGIEIFAISLRSGQGLYTTWVCVK